MTGKYPSQAGKRLAKHHYVKLLGVYGGSTLYRKRIGSIWKISSHIGHKPASRISPFFPAVLLVERVADGKVFVIYPKQTGEQPTHMPNGSFRECEDAAADDAHLTEAFYGENK